MKVAYTQEQLETAINAAMNLSGRVDAYEVDGTTLTSYFTSRSGKTKRSVVHDFDDDGEITGHSSYSLSEHYPGDAAGFGIAGLINDALKNPEEYEIFSEDSGKRIYPEEDDCPDAVADEGISIDSEAIKKGALVTLGACAAGYVCYRLAPEVHARFVAWRQRRKAKKVSHGAAEGTEAPLPDEAAENTCSEA